MDKNIPQIRYAEFTGEWEQVKFSEMAETRRGLTYKPSDVQKNGVRVLRSANISEGKFIKDDNDVFVNREAVNIDCVKNNDILITAANGSQRLVGKHCLVQNVEQNESVHGGFMLLASAQSPEFLNASMDSSWYRDFINFFVAGGNGSIGNLNKADLDNYTLHVPSLPEQEKIGELFRNLDNLIDEEQKRLDKLHAIKAALLQKMFPSDNPGNALNGGGNSLIMNDLQKYNLVITPHPAPNTPAIRFRGYTEPWQKKRLGDVGSTYMGLSGKCKNDFGHGQARYITYMNVYTNTIAKVSGIDYIEIDPSQNKVQYGDVLFTTSSETPEEVGMSSVWLGNTPNTYLNSFCCGYRPTIKNDPYFMAYLMRSNNIRRSFVFLAQGISRFNISKQKAMDIEISFPSLSEQQQIGNFFRTQDEQIAHTARYITSLRTIRTALLQKMFV